MDTDTGTEQYNSQWNQGLHQFLQLKHCCRISPESLKAVFMSNISFFKRYGHNIFGLTGTLGSEGERRLLQELYNIDYVTVPTFRPSRFIEEDGIVCSTEHGWLEEIKKCIVEAFHSRPVLVISETIKDLEKIENYLKESTKDKLHVYKHSYEEPDIFKQTDVKKDCIILATNLAGRGTDIKIGEKTSDAGGLFVCLTYLPSNVRVEQQAFGRTARKGQQGSGRMVILQPGAGNNDMHTKSIATFVNLKARRDVLEKLRVNQIKQDYESKLCVEEDLFNAFAGKFSSFRNILKHKQSKEEHQVEVSLLLHALLDNWALWLDTFGDQIGRLADTDHIKNELHTFLDTIDNAEKEMDRGEPHYKYIAGFANNIKLAKVFIHAKKFKKAQTIFERVIEAEPQFSEAAHYYKAHCIVETTNVKSDSKAFREHFYRAKLSFQKRIDELQKICCYTTNYQ